MLSNRPPLEATAFALLRPLLEATMRGLWLSHCATDEQVENFVSPTRKQLDAASIQLAIDKTVANGSAHTAIYKKHWSALSAYTHTGEHQVQRWLTTKDVEPAYSTAEVSELIKLAGLTMQLTASAVMALRSADVE